MSDSAPIPPFVFADADPCSALGGFSIGLLIIAIIVMVIAIRDRKEHPISRLAATLIVVAVVGTVAGTVGGITALSIDTGQRAQAATAVSNTWHITRSDAQSVVKSSSGSVVTLPSGSAEMVSLTIQHGRGYLVHNGTAVPVPTTN